MKRVTILAGHYGSGKTNIAVNMALDEAKGDFWDPSAEVIPAEDAARRLAIADLDIVNPYFRTEDSREELEHAGIRMICSKYANSNVDLPSMPEDLYAITDDKSLRVIIDVGGDDRGALALGRLSEALKKEADYEMLMVLNCYRPLTGNAGEVMQVMREIEQAGRLKFTGLINNSNLGRETTAQDVAASRDFASEVEKLSGLPLRYTTVEDRIFEDMKQIEREVPEHEAFARIRPLHLQKRPV